LPARLKIGLQALSVSFVVVLLGLFVWKLAHKHHPPKGIAPAFTLSRLDGAGDLSLASLRGKVVVLNFWASWCGPCKEEAPVFERASRRWRSQGVVFIGIDSEDFSGDARKFVRKHGVTYLNLHDGPGKVRDRYGVVGYPETFFVDRQGRIAGKHEVGQVDAESLDANIRRALES
jgi:cytochrome c biogenesis protein CcmG/thiol:disulfide interchange protein DsbE